MSRKMFVSLSIVLAVAACFIAVSCFSAADEKKPAAESADQAADADKKEADKKDPFAVPDGTADELVAYMDTVMKAKPDGQIANLDEFKAFTRKKAGAMLKAADKILAAKPSDQQKTKALQAKLGGLGTLTAIGDAEAKKALAQLPAEFEKAGQPAMAREVKRVIFNLAMRDSRGKPEELKALLAQIKEYLAASPIEKGDVRLIMTVAMMAERGSDKDLALKTLDEFAKLLLASPDKDIATAGRTLEGAARRIGLVGKPMELAGVLLDGKPLDWSKYLGKVVLVDFWATWCPPCRAEVPGMKKNYEAYHDRGFEIVGISLDRDRKELENYVEENKIPWTILTDDEHAKKTDGKDEPADKKAADQRPAMSTYYGVFGIPCMMLVGKDGKVITLEARGEKLSETLEKLLGPVEKKSDEKKSDEKKVDEKKADEKKADEKK